MIYTLTLNPAIDYIMNVENLELGEVNRSSTESKFIGGKGINVSRVLNEIGIESVALGFIGGFTGAYIEKNLKDYKINTDFIKVEEDTRINIKIKSGIESEINANGPYISEEKLKELKEQLSKLKNGDYLVLAGSIQKSLQNDLYVEIQKLIANKDVKIIVDISNNTIISSAKEKAFLVKPNDKELAEIFGVTIQTEKDCIKYGEKLKELGAENVIISMGAKGAILISNEGIFKGSVPKGNVRNSVGAGDSLVAGFVGEYSKSKDILSAFKMGLACGTATAFSLDLCQKELVLNILGDIEITKLSY